MSQVQASEAADDDGDVVVVAPPDPLSSTLQRNMAQGATADLVAAIGLAGLMAPAKAFAVAEPA